MAKNWKTIFTGLNVSFAAIFYCHAIRLAAAGEWAIPHALIGLLWSVIAVLDIKELALELRKR